MFRTYLLVNERIDLLERSAVHVLRKRLKLSRQQCSVLHGRLSARMESVLADQLDMAVLVFDLRLFGVRDHLMFGACVRTCVGGNGNKRILVVTQYIDMYYISFINGLSLFKGGQQVSLFTLD